MVFDNAERFRVDGCTFNEAQRDINYINARGEDPDIRSCVYSVMKDHIYIAAQHDSGARRAPSRCYPGTREAALKTISDWVQDPASQCLWLHGPAGTGKSAIAQTFAEQCDQEGTLGATYFFTRGPITGSGPPPLFPTLAYQLMSRVPDLDGHLWEMIRMDQTVVQKSMTEQLDKLIVQPFQKLVTRPTHIVVVIDGLDEYDDTTIQEEIVRLILGVRAHSLPLRFLVASRPERVIRRAFESSPRSLLTRLSLDKTLLPDRDIRHFLRTELVRIYEECVKDGMPVALQTTPNWPSSEDIDRLVYKSSGHFIYASTVVKFVQEGHGNPMKRLNAVLQISNESTRPSALVQSAAFQELDQLYLHILRKAGDLAVLPRILRAIMYFGDRVSVGNLDAIFSCTDGVDFLLGSLRSIFGVTPQSKVQFLHASMRDFLMDPARSREFYLDLDQFQADLACEYTRLIMLFPLTEPQDSLVMAMDSNGLKACLKGIFAHPGLLSATLEKLAIIIAQGSKPLPTCLHYSAVDYLLRTLKEVPGSDSLCKELEAIQWRLEPQLTKLSSIIFSLVRVLGIDFVAPVPSRLPPVKTRPLIAMRPRSWAKIDQLISMPSTSEIIQQTLAPDVPLKSMEDLLAREIHQSLSRWLLVHRRPKGARGFITPAVQGILRPPPQIAVEKYTWAWAWDTTASLPGWGSQYAVHHLDLIYCCLHTLFLGILQPLNYTPLEEMGLQSASQEIRDHFRSQNFEAICFTSDAHTPTILQQILDRIDFTPISRALPTLRTKFYSRLFYLHNAFDLSHNGVYMFERNPSLRHCFQNMCSHLVQDPIVSRVIGVVWAILDELPLREIELFLGPAPGEPFYLPAMQAIFGVGVLQKGGNLRLPVWIPLLLRDGSVKLQHDVPNNYDIRINNYIYDAHEHLAIACIEHILSCANLGRPCPSHRAGRYAMERWTTHLGFAKHSERLFETLRRVVIRRDDVEPVIEWLEKGTNTPKDILLRWHAARSPRNPDLDGSLFDQYLS